MKLALKILVSFTITLNACYYNSSEVPVIPEQPIDTLLVDLNQKWVGDYLGDRVLTTITPSVGVTYDTTFDVVFSLLEFRREPTKPSEYLYIEFEINNYKYEPFVCNEDVFLDSITTLTRREGHDFRKLTFHNTELIIQDYFNVNHTAYGGTDKKWRGIYLKQ